MVMKIAGLAGPDNILIHQSMSSDAAAAKTKKIAREAALFGPKMTARVFFENARSDM
jgi:hypothetical protein